MPSRSSLPIYLDHNATTPLTKEVQEALAPYLAMGLSSGARHRYGQKARALVEGARSDLSSMLGGQSKELLWTSGATEGINLVLRSLAKKHAKPGEILTSASEHPATIETLRFLEQTLGWKVRYLKPRADGLHTFASLQEQIGEKTRMIVLMAANNETGVIQPIKELAHFLAKDAPSIDLIVDGVAALTKMPLSFYPGVRAMIFSGHKFHALGGCGFVLMRDLHKLPPFLHGGGQEGGIRSGSLFTLGILSMAAALKKFHDDPKIKEMEELRNLLEETLVKNLRKVKIHGGTTPRVSNVSSIYFEGIESEQLLMLLDQAGLYLSQGSACASGMQKLSPVLESMGCPLEELQGTVRFSLARITTREEIERAAAMVIEAVNSLRQGDRHDHPL